jgi:hypothetical protein
MKSILGTSNDGQELTGRIIKLEMSVLKTNELRNVHKEM